MNCLQILNKEIDVDASPVLYAAPFRQATLARDWRVVGGTWTVAGDWLEGVNPASNAGMVMAREDFPGDILLDFEGRTVRPSTHDIDCMWNGSWDETRNQRDVAYVFGLQGWWEGKAGFEKAPDYKFGAVTPLCPFVPGQIHHIQVGSIGGHLFAFVDGRLVIEAIDPDPIDSSRYAKIGFEAYASHIQIRHLRVLRLKWHERKLEYAPES